MNNRVIVQSTDTVVIRASSQVGEEQDIAGNGPCTPDYVRYPKSELLDPLDRSPIPEPKVDPIKKLTFSTKELTSRQMDLLQAGAGVIVPFVAPLSCRETTYSAGGNQQNRRSLAQTLNR